MTITQKLGKYINKSKILLLAILLCTSFSISGCSGKVEATTSLSTYDYGSDLAKNSLNTLLVYDSDSYNRIKSDLKGVLSTGLYKQHFESDEYTGYTLSKPTLTVNSIKGDMTNKDKMVFKIDITFTSGGTTDNATMLVTVENSAVTYIERI